MPDALIYDHVRTPRGRGKSDGALHEVTTLNLAAQTLAAVKARNHLDPALVDDVVLGCVDPVGEAGGDIARAAALTAGYGNGVPGVQINRFCASGLDAVNELLKTFEVPVIFITAYPERFLTGERPEPAFLIAKPFQPAMVSAIASQALFFARNAKSRKRQAAH